MKKTFPLILLLAAQIGALALTGALAAGCDPAPPKDNSNVQEPPPPPPPGNPGAK